MACSRQVRLSPTKSPLNEKVLQVPSTDSLSGCYQVYSAAMDFALVGMAWLVVSRLQMHSTREKLGVGIAMSMGVFAGATSIVKAVILLNLSTGDISYTSATLHIWSFAEPSVTIIAASIPLLRVLFTHVRQMTTRTGATKADQSTSGPSFGGSDKRTMTSTVTGTQGGPDVIHLANLDANNMSDENVILENLQEIARVEFANKEQAVERDEERGEEQALATPRRNSPLSSSVYERRLAEKYADGVERSEPV